MNTNATLHQADLGRLILPAAEGVARCCGLVMCLLGLSLYSHFFLIIYLLVSMGVVVVVGRNGFKKVKFGLSGMLANGGGPFLV